VKKDTHRQVVVRVCEALKAERIKQDISQQKLSEMAGISRTGIRHLESLDGLTPIIVQF
jgi:transcriptional regulator with XRE-family HTH domain